MLNIQRNTNFSINTINNILRVNFLDVTFNLTDETYRPYKRPNDEIKYINVLSNHPPQIIKQLVNTINNTLSRNLPGEKLFNESKNYYEDALNKNGYKTQLKYKTLPTSRKSTNKNRKRKIIWFIFPTIRVFQ